MTTQRSITGFGLEYEQQVSPRRARALALMYPLPKPGEELCVAVAKDSFDCWHRLYLQNVSGTYALACCTYSKAQWLEHFKVQP